MSHWHWRQHSGWRSSALPKPLNLRVIPLPSVQTRLRTYQACVRFPRAACLLARNHPLSEPGVANGNVLYELSCHASKSTSWSVSASSGTLTWTLCPMLAQSLRCQLCIYGDSSECPAHNSEFPKRTHLAPTCHERTQTIKKHKKS